MTITLSLRGSVPSFHISLSVSRVARGFSTRHAPVRALASRPEPATYYRGRSGNGFPIPP